MVQFKTGASGPAVTNWFLVANEETKQAFVVDVPPDSLNDIVSTAEDLGVSITDILLTHTHWDHTVDCAALAKKFNARVSVHSQDAYRLLDPMDHTIWPLPFTIEPVVPDRFLADGQVIKPAGIALKVLHTPGHTEGGVSFVDELHKKVFAGDTLFSGSVGRTDLPGGDMEILERSIKEKLFNLDDDYQVLCGHGPTTTIGDERQNNPFVGESAR